MRWSPYLQDRILGALSLEFFPGKTVVLLVVLVHQLFGILEILCAISDIVCRAPIFPLDKILSDSVFSPTSLAYFSLVQECLNLVLPLIRILVVNYGILSLISRSLIRVGILWSWF